MAYKPSDRLSAAQALAHPWLVGGAVTPRNALEEVSTATAGTVGTALATAGRTVGKMVSDVGEMSGMVRRGVVRVCCGPVGAGG